MSMRSFCAVLLATAAVAAQAAAAMPSIRVVGDAQLAQARGRGIPGNAITGFRLELVSSWNNPQGALGASGTLQVSGLGGAQPAVQWVGSAGGRGSISGAATGSTSGALEVGGIGQLTQVAGDANQATNSFTLQLLPDGTALAPIAPGAAAASYSAGGASARIGSDGHGGLVLAIVTPLGSATQAFGSAIGQALHISGDGQTVRNDAVLTVLTHASSGIASPALLQQLRNAMPRS